MEDKRPQMYIGFCEMRLSHVNICVRACPQGILWRLVFYGLSLNLTLAHDPKTQKSHLNSAIKWQINLLFILFRWKNSKEYVHTYHLCVKIAIKHKIENWNLQFASINMFRLKIVQNRQVWLKSGVLWKEKKVFLLHNRCVTDKIEEKIDATSSNG